MQRRTVIRMSGDLSASPVPERITLALDACGLYGPEVDLALGGAEPMVDEWEAGKRAPTREQVALLADLTGFPVEFFYRTAASLGPVWLCRRSGRGKGCTYIPAPPPITSRVDSDDDLTLF